jgi:hypothetical protein
MTGDELQTDMRDGFKRVDDEFSRVRAEIRAEAEATRRHFDIVAESLRESVKMIAEGHAHSSARLDNHETRLKRLERPRRR